MNGRIYDPTLGRFLQADPIIQAPTDSQSYNRYAYVRNNPLSLTDPSGYSWLSDKWKEYGKLIVGAVVAIVTYGAASGWVATWGATWGSVSATGAASLTWAGGAAAGAISGFAAGAVSTGSLRGALNGALSGAVFGGIGASGWSDGATWASHALAGGVLSDLQGGNFGHGFITAGVMKGFGKINNTGDIYARTILQAMVGGTVSRITGGKFANGAVTAAIQFVVNEKSGWIRKQWESMKNSFRIIGSEGSKYVNESAQQISDEMTQGGERIAASAKNAAAIAYNNPGKTLAAAGSVITGMGLCSTVLGCTIGAPLTAYGVDQTNALINGNSMTATQQFLGDVLSHPDARAAFPFIENPHAAAGTILDVSTFAAGGAGSSTYKLYNGSGNVGDIVDTMNNANTLSNY